MYRKCGQIRHDCGTYYMYVNTDRTLQNIFIHARLALSLIHANKKLTHASDCADSLLLLAEIPPIASPPANMLAFVTPAKWTPSILRGCTRLCTYALPFRLISRGHLSRPALDFAEVMASQRTEKLTTLSLLSFCTYIRGREFATTRIMQGFHSECLSPPRAAPTGSL